MNSESASETDFKRDEKNFSPLPQVLLDGGAKMSFFFLNFFYFLSNVDWNFALFNINYKKSEEPQKKFFNIFEQFFVDLRRFKIFKQPFCYEISKVQWNFFFKKNIIYP